MTRILAFETSAQQCSVAISYNDEMVQKVHTVPRTHNEHIHDLVRSVLAEAGLGLPDIDYMAVSIGPGSFTGIRLGLSVVQGFAYGCGVPVIPISTLAAMAEYGYQQAPMVEKPLLIGLDARMGQIYWALYQKSPTRLVEAVCPDALSNPADIVLPQAGYAIGPGWGAYQDNLSVHIQSLIHKQAASIIPYAASVARLARVNINQAIAPEALQAQYLRNQVAHAKKMA